MRVVARNQLTPDVSYDPLARRAPEPAGGSPITTALMQLVRPAFYIEGVPGVGTISLEPYGKPTQNLGLPVTIGVVAFGLGALYGFWRLAQVAERRRSR